MIGRALATSNLTRCLGFALMTCLPGTAHAQAVLPAGGTVASGNATIATGATSVTVGQTSDKAIINWTGFSVGTGNTVTFNQPSAQSATLNRVTGSETSSIAGKILSNGAVYLINPNGIAITSTGVVRTGGGFVASSLDIADSDFNAGTLAFAGNGASGRVSNKGNITAGSGGFVALLGGTVLNTGTITVPLGRVGLGSGENIALDINGGGFLRVATPTAVITAGNTALIEMTGQIAAAGGRVELSAATVKDAVRNVINLTGNINADSAVSSGGTILLLGGAGGSVNVTGTLSARATGAGGDGGLIETSGATLNYVGAKIDTTAAGGRTGDWVIDPTDLTVDAAAAATIASNLATSNVTLQTNADGTTSGPGNQSPGNGDIVVNSAITWNSANTLRLLAYNNIALNAAITGTAGGLTLTAGNNVANTGAISATGAVNVGIFNLTNGNWSQLTATLPAFFARDFRFTVGRANFLRATGGTGAAATPYVFTDVFGLQGYASRSYLSASATLGGDIDASGTVNWNAGAGFNPIGTISNGFSGTFNGANHIISGLTINRPTTDFVGLFGSSAGNAPTIRNVGLVGGSVKGRQYVGPLIGDLENGSVSDSYASVAATGTGVVGGLAGNAISLTRAYATGTVTSTGNYAGGLVGLSGAFGITDSYATGAVSSTGLYTGGLAGNSSGTISNSYATGSVTATGQYTGGLIGMTYTRVISSYATGAVSGTTSVGGLVGTNTNGNATATITNSYWDVYSSGQGQAAGNVTNVAGVSAVTSDPAQSAAANYAYKASAYANLTAVSGLGTATPTGFVFLQGDTTRPFLAFEAPVAGNPGFFTNAANQVVLRNSHQFQLVGYNGTTLSGSYALAGNIDLAETGRAVAGTPGSYSGMWAGTGWVPLGTNGAGLVFDGTNFVGNSIVGFSGSLNGGGYSVSNLSINRPLTGGFNGRFVALFGYTSTGTISNFGIASGTVRGRSTVGGLVGEQRNGTLSNVYSGANVIGSTTSDGGLVGVMDADAVINGAYTTGTVSGTSSVGGLVGLMRGTVSNVYATGAITGSASGIGGLAGFMNGGTLTNAYATGAVNGGGSGQSIGGLIGAASSATIRYAYATGSVIGYDYVGGLIGSLSYGTTDNVYASGAVNVQNQDVGALVGNSYEGTLTNAYWDSYTSGQTAAVGYGDPGSNIVAVTSDPAQSGAANYAYKASAYANLTAAAGIGTATPTGFVFMTGDSTRPFLAFEVPTSFTAATDASGRLVIVNSHQLQLIGYDGTRLTGSYSLGNAIDLSETGRAVAGTPGSYSGMWTGAGWVPLGTDGGRLVYDGTSFVLSADLPTDTYGFRGIFNGNGFAVTNLMANRALGNNVGLFGVASGSLSNLILSGTVTGVGRVGGLVGLQYNGSISGVTSAVVVNGGVWTGGLVGYATSVSISGSSASGAVTTDGDFGISGGLIGYSYYSTITNSSATGNVAGRVNKTGGLIGVIQGGSVSGGTSTGTVNGAAGPGPLLGQTRSGATVTP